MSVLGVIPATLMGIGCIVDNMDMSPDHREDVVSKVKALNLKIKDSTIVSPLGIQINSHHHNILESIDTLMHELAAWSAFTGKELSAVTLIVFALQGLYNMFDME